MPYKKAIQFEDLEPRYQAIIANALDGIITISEDGTMESVNPAALEIFGYEESEMLGANIKMLVPEKEDIGDKKPNNCLVIGKHSIGRGREVMGRRKDGTVFPFLLSMSEVILSNQKTFIGIVHDISELKDVKEKLIKEKELSELKSRFVSMASHEFRTPLSAILSSISLIARYNENEDVDKRMKHVNRIRASVDNLTSILNGFLSLSKLEEGVRMIDVVTFDLTELVEDVTEELNGILKDGQQIIYTHHDEEKNIVLDKSLLRNVMINLVSNAIKYSKEGKKIWISTYVNEAEMIFVVKDEGIGIPAYEQKYLFTRFFRAQNATSISGTGLGLNIVKKYLDLIKGDITFISNHQGTTFTVHIPL